MWNTIWLAAVAIYLAGLITLIEAGVSCTESLMVSGAKKSVATTVAATILVLWPVTLPFGLYVLKKRGGSQ